MSTHSGGGDDRDGPAEAGRPAGMPLLDTDGDLAAGALVADGRTAENELAVLAGNSFADLEVVARLRDRIRRGEEARAQLLLASRPLVSALAHRHDEHEGRAQLLLSAGHRALERAVDRYDPTGGLPFAAFARWWVERAMREVDLHPIGATHPSRVGLSPADPALLTALGHLHEDDCRVIELRLGLAGPALTPTETADTLGVDLDEAEEREELALAKLRHPCTPGNLTHLQKI